MKKLMHKALNALGFEIRRTRATPTDVIGKDPWDDIASFLNSDRPIVIDVGANEGQTVLRCRSRFPNCVLHAFEPSPDTFSLLRQNCGDLPDVHLWNSAIGATECQLTLLENSSSAMSSILELGQHGWGKIVKETNIQVTTIDAFCRANGIDHIDILKSDTQGFDFEVLKGCEEMMQKGKISLVYFEVIFSEQYKGVASFGEVYEFLRSHEFRLVTFYELYYQAGLASWTDVLFVHESLLQPKG